MHKRVFYFFRVFSTGFCFAIFGVGGIFLRMFAFPFLYLLVWNANRRIAIARKLIRISFQLFIGLMQALGVLQFEFTGMERLERKGLLILANHPTLIDTVFLMAFVKHADCIVKAELQANLFTRGAVTAAGYIFNDHGSELIDACVKSIQRGNNLIIFPEGTRTSEDGQISFKRGAANVAVRAQCNITPVLITCQPKTLSKGEKWWHIPPSRAIFRIAVQEDIEIEKFINESASDMMAARHLTSYLQTYFAERI